jgi:FKBP-type peptidyl-prolyl cis-trans isomerase FklB
LFSSQVFAEDKELLKSQKDKVSYIIGADIGGNLKKQSIDINPEILMKGLKDGLAGNKPLLSDEEVVKTMEAFKQEMMKKHEEEVKKIGEKNRKEGDEFLAENKKKEGIVSYRHRIRQLPRHLN